MSVRFEIDVSRIENSPGVVSWMNEFAAAFIEEAQLLTAERIGKTDEYGRSFRAELAGGSPPVLQLGNVAPFAVYVEEDTEPHTITPQPPGRRSFTNPKRPGALRWFDPPGGGKDAAMFAREVHHPGTTGQHIVRDAVSRAGDRLQP